MSVFHRHVWKIVEKAEQPAPVELFRSSGGMKMRGFEDGFFSRSMIVTYRCERCAAEKVERV